MEEDRKQLFDKLVAAAQTGIAYNKASGSITPGDAAQALELLEALRQGAFHFKTEIWHDIGPQGEERIYPAELLLRAQTPGNRSITPFDPISAISKAGLQEQFDKAIILAGIDQALAQNLMPIAINTSARNMTSAAFWQDISEMLRTYFSPDEIRDALTFEVTEDHLADNLCLETLTRMKGEFGCRIALDDFGHDFLRTAGSRDWERLENLKGVIDAVKIDRTLVVAAQSKKAPLDLAALIHQIKAIAPHVSIVLEGIENAGQAHRLRPLADAVQGHSLPADRETFRQNLLDCV